MRTRIIIYTAVLLLACSCKTQPVYIPVEQVRMEYINNYRMDSLVRYDSVYIREKADSVLIEKFSYIYRDRIQTDTLLRSDTIQVPYPIIRTVETNRLSGWQWFQVWCGRSLLAILLIFLLLKVIRKRVS